MNTTVRRCWRWCLRGITNRLNGNRILPSNRTNTKAKGMAVIPDHMAGRRKERKGMKIKVTPEIVVDVEIIQKQVCPAGSSYWDINYLVDGICIHNATTGAIYGKPNPIATLDREFDTTEYHYQDIPNPDPEPQGDERKGRSLGGGSSSNRPAWWEVKHKTHREAIINAVNQVVV